MHNKPTQNILVITSYPPRECGIATYSHDLIKALKNKFSNSFSIKVCALETENACYQYPEEVKYILNTSLETEYEKLAKEINKDSQIKIILIQHEFGFYATQESAFQKLLNEIYKPIVIAFHTVLPKPDNELKTKIKNISNACTSVIVMTNNSSEILINEYGIPKKKITIIPHGTHLVSHLNRQSLKQKYGLTGRKVLSTFGLLSSGKSIETTIDALMTVVKECPEVIFLIIGKTHPEVVKTEGEKYRKSLIANVILNKLTNHVKFINSYLELPELLEYLQLTDIYLFTSNDPNQAVSGTFVYAMSCACPIISTPIPHAKEILSDETGIIFDFNNSQQLAEETIRLLKDDNLRKSISSNTLQKIVSTAWENSAIAHAMLLEKISEGIIPLHYNLPEISMSQLKTMTTNIGIIQFSKLNQADPESGYTLDDNARALISACMHFKLKGDQEDLSYIRIYLRFIRHCLQPEGAFLNYRDKNSRFTDQNTEGNLDDANGRAIWALGFLISAKEFLPDEIISDAVDIIQNSFTRIEEMHSTRAMAFSVKGLYFFQKTIKTPSVLKLIKTFADRLVQMYMHESQKNWEWFESYLTYANSILPEALLYSWLLTDELKYKNIAVSSLKFLINQTFNENGIKVISNNNWLQRGKKGNHFGEQPIDVAYTIMTLSKFYDELKDEDYFLKMQTAFNWFLGNNHLHQIMYNPCTGGCYDGLEETQVNLNQGAESTLSYLMARMTIEKYKIPERNPTSEVLVHIKKSKKTDTMIPMAMKFATSIHPYYFITNGSGITVKELGM
jgi:glycosyltransferase involved in cell wall biosynthesis